jgi:membrane fusion protein, adhesin transport system
MLNISNNSVSGYFIKKQFASLRMAEQKKSGRVFINLILFFMAFGFLTMFIPWTQNIRSAGSVTTLKPDQRPQTVHAIIAGRIEKWFVQEGDFVNKGDTILFISEIKDNFFDPDLILRTQQQLDAKGQSVYSYIEKVKALDNQINALIETNRLKLEQATNKLQQAKLTVISDSMDYKAADINFKIAIEQLKRMEEMYQQGLKSLTDLENRKLTKQRAQAEVIASENRLLTSKNEVLNAQIELTSIRAQFQNSIAKAESEKYTAMSDMYDAEAVVTKLQNEFTNYSIRSGLYYIKAAQDGYVTRAISYGIGETVKEGQEIVSIMPARYDLAVEMYVKPLDLPLIERGQHVRIQFDGWPAIVFSGWPNTSYGTFGGVVFAIDNFISPNGLYRILVSPDPKVAEWPDALRIGAGTNNMLLLKDVPIWYELWRQVNGFPPDYYKPISPTTSKEKQ